MTTGDSHQRQALALDAIRRAFGTQAGEDGVNLFVEHHLEDLPGEYWKQYTGMATPEPAAVLGLLQFRSSWGENDAEYVDFTLPGEVTDYVVSVHFDDAGEIDGISMES
jgi:hypothetical protein